LDVEGWVEVALLARFRNMRALTSDLAVIVEALRASKYLAVSSDGFRARWQRGQLQTWINQLQLLIVETSEESGEDSNHARVTRGESPHM
jgi:hypothetical protein